MIPFNMFAALALIPGALTAPSWLPQLGDLLHGRDTGAKAVSEVSAAGNLYWSFWQEGNGNFRCNNGAGGQYSATWSGRGGFVCGKGWSPGGGRKIKYSGTYDPTGPGYLSIYGWTRNPLVEYYIVESHGDLTPGEPWTLKGNFTFEEGTYQLYTSMRVNKPSILGTSTFQQYWSVRTEKRVGGTVSTQRHFTEWNKAGMRLGGHDYMIVATEGYSHGNNNSKGTANINIDG